MNVDDGSLFGYATVGIPLEPRDMGISHAAQRETNLLRERAVPEEWLPYCWALDWELPGVRGPNVDSRIALRVGGNAPPRTMSELRLAADLGLGFNLVVPDGFDLRTLAPVLPQVELLTLDSVGRVHGADVIASAVSLRLLAVSCMLGAGVPRTGLPLLESYSGSGELLLLACSSPSLQKLDVDLEGQPWPTGVPIAGAVEHLNLEGAGALGDLPALARPASLRRLRLSGAPRVDLMTLPNTVDLEWFEIRQTAELVGTSALTRMSRLRYVLLERVKRVESPESLTGLGARELYVSRSDPRAVGAAKARRHRNRGML